jgi:hypothetical protein
MPPVSKQRIGKHAFRTIKLLMETVFSIRHVQSGYKEKNWDNQFSWALQGRLRRDGATVDMRDDSSVVKKIFANLSCEKKLYVSCNYSETVLNLLPG